MKRLVAIVFMFVASVAFAQANPTDPNSSYKNQQPKGAKGGSKEIRKDQVDRNYKRQGTLKVEAVNPSNVRTTRTTRARGSYKHPYGL